MAKRFFFAREGGLPIVGKKIPNVNTINFETVDRPRGGGQGGQGYFVNFCHYVMLFRPF